MTELRDIVFPHPWTRERLRKFRKELGLKQREIGDILGMSAVTISNLEIGRKTNPALILMYGEALERYYAWTQGYIPSYRKVGEMEFADIKL